MACARPPLYRRTSECRLVGFFDGVRHRVVSGVARWPDFVLRLHRIRNLPCLCAYRVGVNVTGVRLAQRALQKLSTLDEPNAPCAAPPSPGLNSFPFSSLICEAVPIPPASSARCWPLRALGSDRCAWREPGRLIRVASWPHIWGRFEGHREDCCFLASPAVVHGVHC